MGWYVTPKAGSDNLEFCAEACGHVDCAQSRRDVASLCRICEKVIGEGTRVYYEKAGIVHAVCLEDGADREAGR